jgi:putative restriction endonuclease
MDIDIQVRLAAFHWLSEQVNLYGDVLPKKLLQQGFEFQGQRISLISPQGIYTPKNFSLPIAFHTVPEGPYNDGIGPDNLLDYKYRGKDPNHRDNVGLRKAMELKRPLAYFHGIVPGRYLAIWPVYIVADIPNTLTFKAVLDDIATVALEENVASRFISDGAEARRSYITATVRVRVHQRSFRERVVKAYNSQCAFCRLKHQELLDAAHIIPDSAPEGEPVITNGISLCKLHHAAYDSFILGVTPDYVIHVREDILEEEDGPVLQHGLKGLHNTKLILPRQKNHYPSREALDWRYSRFIRAA